MIWSLCGAVNEEGRYRVDNYIREIEGLFPLRDTVYEYLVDARLRAFVSWEERLPQAWRFPPGCVLAYASATLASLHTIPKRANV